MLGSGATEWVHAPGKNYYIIMRENNRSCKGNGFLGSATQLRILRVFHSRYDNYQLVITLYDVLQLFFLIEMLSLSSLLLYMMYTY
jgi:hypothetical protein